MFNDLIKCPICKSAEFLQPGTGWQGYVLPGLMRCANNKVDFGDGKYYHFALMLFQYEAYIFGNIQIYFYDNSIALIDLTAPQREKYVLENSIVRYEDINSVDKLKNFFENSKIIS